MKIFSKNWKIEKKYFFSLHQEKNEKKNIYKEKISSLYSMDEPLFVET